MDTTRDIEEMAGIRLPDGFNDTLRKVTKTDTEYELSRRRHVASVRRKATYRKTRKWKYDKKLNSRKWTLPTKVMR